MSKFPAKLKSLFKSRKINAFALFFLLAFGILILSKLTEEYTNTAKFKVNLLNVPDETVILNDSLNHLNLTLTTTGFKWLKYAFREPKLTIDFENEIKKIDTAYVWSNAQGYAGILEQFKKDVKIVSITPDTLLFDFDINAVKYIPVKSNLDINYSLGYDTLKGLKITPDSVKIIGPSTVLSKLKYIETSALQLESVNKSFKETVDLRLDSINSKINIKTKTVSVSAIVEKFTEGTLNIPIQVINVPKTITLNYFPKTINVSFYTSLSAFKTITPNSFKIICDYKTLNKNSKYLEPKLIKRPSNVKTTRLHQQKIEFIIIE